MSRQGTEFLHYWIRLHLSDAEMGGDRTPAMVLADTCRDAAVGQGLSIDDEPEWESLESIIYSKMHPSVPQDQRSKKVWRAMWS